MSATRELIQKPITIDSDSVVYEGIRKFLDNKISRLLVSKNDEIVGIITEKDVGFFLLNDTGKAVVHNADKIAKKKKISIKTKILRGWPGIETVKFAKQGKFDHIVMSTTGTGGANNEMFGSVSNYVTHKAKVPIYLVK